MTDGQEDEYVKQLSVKDLVIESLNRKIEELTELNNIMKERISELNYDLMETENNSQLNNITYWRGVESSYEKVISELIDRVTAKEIEIFGLEMENEYLKNQLNIEEE